MLCNIIIIMYFLQFIVKLIFDQYNHADSLDQLGEFLYRDFIIKCLSMNGKIRSINIFGYTPQGIASSNLIPNYTPQLAKGTWVFNWFTKIESNSRNGRPLRKDSRKN